MKLNFRRGGAFASNKARKYLQNKKPEDFTSITIIRHAAIGDFVVMRPFLLELKNFFPNAKLTLNVLRNYMYGIPYDLVDDVFITDKYQQENKHQKTSFLFRVKQARALLRQDIIFDLTDSSMSLLFVVFARKSLKIGYPYRGFRRFFYDITTLRSDFVLETKGMLHQLNVLGANTHHYPLEYGLTQVKCNRKTPFIIYFAGASIEARLWGSDNFINLIKKMKKQYPNYNHVILKGINSNEYFDDIYFPFKNDLNVKHQDSLPLESIYDYLASASLVVVGDTGLRNMAIACSTPTLGVMFANGVSPHRYLPKTKEHQVEYTTEYEKPDVNNVYKTLINMIETIYENNIEKN